MGYIETSHSTLSNENKVKGFNFKNEKVKEYGIEKKGLKTQIKELCMLCLEQVSNAVILKCGHANICFLCAFKIYKSNKLCHLCR